VRERSKDKDEDETKPEIIHTNIPYGACLMNGSNWAEVVQRVSLLGS